MKTLKLYSLLIILILGFSSCQSEKPVDEVEKDKIESVFQSSEALFRGSNTGEAPSTIRSNEKASSIVDTDSLLHYHSTYNFEYGVSDVDIFYTFDEYGLFEIQVDFYPEEAEAPKMLMQEIEKILTTRFGDPKELGLLMRWTTFSSSNNVVEITLSNESADAGEPFVSLNFLEPLPDEI